MAGRRGVGTSVYGVQPMRAYGYIFARNYGLLLHLGPTPVVAGQASLAGKTAGHVTASIPRAFV